MLSFKAKKLYICLFAIVLGSISWFSFHTKNINFIIDSPIMQRLKDIDQSGPSRYIGKIIPKYSRFEHSIGVMEILKNAGCTENEQIAGLLHDASHTVFSHVADYVFGKDNQEFSESSYQDSIHETYLKNNNIEKYLKQINKKLEDIVPEKNDFNGLDQKLPDMCADRIEYNIKTGIIMNRISEDEGMAILKDIKYENKKWFFRNIKLAKKFAELSVYFTQNFWSAKWNVSMNIHFANAIKRALQINLLSKDDMFSTDLVVLKKLQNSNDETIRLNLIQSEKPLEKMCNCEYRTEKITPKFRGIDPLIKTKSGELKRLSELDIMFKHYYEEVKAWCLNGYEIEILDKQY